MGDLLISGVGLVCNVGVSAPAACAAIRAHVHRFEETLFRDLEGGAIYAATVPELVNGRQAHMRLSPLLQHALAECLDTAESTPSETLSRVPCLIVIDGGERPDHSDDLPQQLRASIAAAFGVNLHPATQVVAAGQFGVFQALRVAEKLVERYGRCVVAAVDSLVNRKLLRLMGSRRLLKTESDSDGVIPGEAAAAICVCRPGTAPREFARIRGLGVSDEVEDASVRPNVGRQLATAIRRALQDAGMELQDIDFRLAGLSGMRAEFLEASNALARVQRVHKDDFEFWSPCEQLGAIGAATPLSVMVVGATGIAMGYAPGSRALLYCLAPSSPRAACVLVGAKG